MINKMIAQFSMKAIRIQKSKQEITDDVAGMQNECIQCSQCKTRIKRRTKGTINT